MFDRDYAPVEQPPIIERGTIMVINRSFDTFLGEQATNDTLKTDDLQVYRSEAGPWVEQTITVLVNNEPVLPAEFRSHPEKGLIVFGAKRLPGDVVQLSNLTQPSDFRVGLKITNPTLEEGRFDAFAYKRR